jgi:spermidine synthase
LFSKKSDFQLVQVVDTLDYGPMLILDGFANLAESDTVEYTHSLMNLPAENYAVSRLKNPGQVLCLLFRVA